MARYCSVFGCLSTSRNDSNRSFFRFPRDESRCMQWIQIIGRPELAEKPIETLHMSYFACDLHFQASDRLVKRLKSNAVPTLNLPHLESVNPEKITQTDKVATKEVFTQVAFPFSYSIKSELEENSSQTTQDLSVNTPRKRKLSGVLRRECKKRKSLENQIECSSAFQKYDISPQLKHLIDLQYKLRRNSKGKRYEMDFKLFAMSMYFASPLAYRVLAKTLSLPSERALRRMNINVGTKISSNVLNCLESKLKNLQENEKYCIICADEISLKRNLYYQIDQDTVTGFHEIDGVKSLEPARQAFVIMAKGIFSNWKQQLGYSFLAQSKNYKDLHEWITDVITNIMNIGFIVVAFVSDQGSNFLNMARERNVSAESPFFLIGGKKIYYIFDIPHLFKSVRNSLIKYDFEFLDNEGTKVTAKWEHVQNLYQNDSKNAYRLAPKLSEFHVNPNNYEKMRVKYATQVFSNTTAAAMNCLVQCGQLPSSASGTVKLISLLDKTFDVLNSSTVKNSNKYKTAFAGKQHQTEILDQFEEFLSNVTVVDKKQKNVTNSIKCLKGLKISISSIKSLFEDLKSKGFKFVLTRRLNQDALKNFFEAVRLQGGNCREPTPIQFNRAFRKLFMANLIKHSEGSNCSEDFDRLLMNKAVSATVTFDKSPQAETGPTTSKVAIGTVDYRFSLPEQNAFQYVCGYLLKKCADMHHCEQMQLYIQNVQENQGESNCFTRLKSYNEKKVLLLNPPKSFVSCIRRMDNKFKNVFKHNILSSVGTEILKEINDIFVEDCCPCFPNVYLRKLFVRFRIYNTLRFNNRSFKDKSFKHKYLNVSNL